MKRHRLLLSDAAVNDVLEQFAWYQEKAGTRLARRWQQAVTSSFLQIVTNPLLGASCNFKVPELAGVRRLGIRHFPRHLVFYRVLQRDLLVLRVVHGARDLESLF